MTTCNCCRTCTDPKCTYPHCPKEPVLKIEVGKKYKDRSNRIWEVLSYVSSKQRYICGQPGLEHSLSWRNGNGTTGPKDKLLNTNPGDFISEYIEPRKKEITLYLQQVNNEVVITGEENWGIILGKKTLTIKEGDGMI